MTRPCGSTNHGSHGRAIVTPLCGASRIRATIAREQVGAGFAGCCVFVVVAAALTWRDVEGIDLRCSRAVGVAGEGGLGGETRSLVPPWRVTLVQRELVSGHVESMRLNERLLTDEVPQIPAVKSVRTYSHAVLVSRYRVDDPYHAA